MKYLLSIVVVFAVTLPSMGQSIRLTPYGAGTAFYVDAYRFFNYNLYEHARFELGGTWVVPNENALNAKGGLGQLRLSGYGAYGIYDKAFKWGAGAEFRVAGAGDVRLGATVKDDLERAASRQLEDYRMTTTSMNSGYLASRFCRVQGVECKVAWRPAARWRSAVRVRYSRELCLYDPPQEWKHFVEGNARVDYNDMLTVVVTPGTTEGSAYVRALGQFAYGKLDEGFHFWAQGGFATGDVPETRLFDVSGTGGTPYYFEHTLLTVRPDRFVTDCFAQVCVKYTSRMALWETTFSRPRPFVQAGAVWGHGVPLLAEPATGFDGLLRWGLVDMGVAVAYQIASVDNRAEDWRESVAFAIVARLIV